MLHLSKYNIIFKNSATYITRGVSWGQTVIKIGCRQKKYEKNRSRVCCRIAVTQQRKQRTHRNGFCPNSNPSSYVISSVRDDRRAGTVLICIMVPFLYILKYKAIIWLRLVNIFVGTWPSMLWNRRSTKCTSSSHVTSCTSILRIITQLKYPQYMSKLKISNFKQYQPYHADITECQSQAITAYSSSTAFIYTGKLQMYWDESVIIWYIITQ